MQFTTFSIHLRFILLFTGFYFNILSEASAQKKDYVIIADTVFSEGYIDAMPSANNTVIYFKRTSHEEFKKYTVDEVTQLQHNYSKFYSKTVQIGTDRKKVFLELLPQNFNSIKLWVLHEEKKVFFIEQKNELIQLTSSYKEILSEKIGIPELEPLIRITNLSLNDLEYLLKQAHRYERPRSYVRLVGITPNVGFTLLTNKFNIPLTDYKATVASSGPLIGFTTEVFLNFNRTISINLSPVFSKFDSQQFQIYKDANRNYETDIFLEYTSIQIPITLKYYIDLRPNKWRLYVEMGYGKTIIDYKKQGMFVAQKSENSLTTTIEDLTLNEKLHGYYLGLGLEKHFQNNRSVVLGFKNNQSTSVETERINATSVFVGYKF